MKALKRENKKLRQRGVVRDNPFNNESSVEDDSESFSSSSDSEESEQMNQPRISFLKHGGLFKRFSISLLGKIQEKEIQVTGNKNVLPYQRFQKMMLSMIQNFP